MLPAWSVRRPEDVVSRVRVRIVSAGEIPALLFVEQLLH
jgi:hypothetical protein